MAEDLGKNLSNTDARLALPCATDVLQNSQSAESLRRAAAYMIGRLDEPLRGSGNSPEVQDALSGLIRRASGDDPKAQRAAVEALDRFGQQELLGDRAPDALRAFAMALKHNIGRDVNLQRASAEALGHFGSAAASAVPDLGRALLQPDQDVKRAAAVTLGQIGPDAKAATDALVIVLENGNSEVQKAAAFALGHIQPSAPIVIPRLITTLRSGNAGVREAAATALGSFATDPDAFPELIKRVGDTNPNVRVPVANVLGGLAESLQQKVSKARKSGRSVLQGEGKIISELSDAEDAITSTSQASTPGDTSRDALNDALMKVQRALKEIRFNPWTAIRQDHPFMAWGLMILAGYGVWFLVLQFMVLRYWPLRLLAWNEKLGADASITLPEWLLKLKVPVRYLLLVGFFRYSPRVLDAWVDERSGAAAKNFARRDTVQSRRTYVALPVLFDGIAEPIATLTPHDLRSICSENHWCLRIIGEGGSGKTTLACQIAFWALEPDRTKRLCPARRMIPVLIEPGIGSQIGKSVTAFTRAVLGQLQDLTGVKETIAEQLLDRLLRTQRVLVILDGVSEMDYAGSAHQVSPTNPGFPASALLITSRTDEYFGDGTHTDVRPLRIDRNHLSPFITAYLSQERIGLPDSDLFEACKRLTLMVGNNRGITPLLAKLYAESLIGFCKEGRPLQNLPGTVPDLMLAYLNELNRSPKEGRLNDVDVHEAAKQIAWQCIHATFRPGRAARDQVHAFLATDGTNQSMLDYLENRLHLIETVPPAKTKVQFVLDPLAEYLAALYTLELGGSDEQQWRKFLEIADQKAGAPKDIEEFLMAARDCIESKGNEAGVPKFVTREIDERVAAVPLAMAAEGSG